jgi:hypothetical protein
MLGDKGDGIEQALVGRLFLRAAPSLAKAVTGAGCISLLSLCWQLKIIKI